MNTESIAFGVKDRLHQLLRIFKVSTAGCLVAGMLGAGGVVRADSPVVLGFQNNTGISSSQIYIQFLGGGSVTGSFVDTATGSTVILQPNTSYSLAELQNSSLDLSQFSGRIYVNYGAYGLSSLGTDNGGYTPAAATTTDPNYNTRYQYFETTITPQANGSSTYYGDLSYIDFTAMSMSMSAMNTVTSGGTTTFTNSFNTSISNYNQVSANTQTLVNAVLGSAQSQPLAILPNGASSVLPNSGFARVISPQFSASGPSTDPSAVYHDFSNYLNYLNTNSVSVNLAGTFVGTGSQPSGNPATQAQTYDFTATFNSSGTLILTSNGTLSGLSNVSWINGTSTANLGVGGNVTISISEGALNASSGIYGNNVPYTVTVNGSIVETTTGLTNDVYGRVVGDLLAGLSFGYVGSTQTFDFQGNTVQLGQMPSSEWWASGESQGSAPTYIPTLSGTTIVGLAVTYAQTPSYAGEYFSEAQPGNSDFYNGYAASLGGTTALTTGYGFPLQDRLGNNLLSYNTVVSPNTGILLTLNPDGSTPILTGTWTGSTGNSQWNVASNWLVNGSGTGGTGWTAGVPVSGASVQFGGASSTGTYIIDTQTDQTVGGIDFNYGAGTFIINNNTITLNGDVVNSSSNTQTINSNLIVNTNSNIVAAYGDLALNGSITLSGTSIAEFWGNENTVVNGVVSGTGSISMSGPGTLVLNGANTFSGGINHEGGTLILGDDTAAGTGTMTFGNTNSSGAPTILQAGGGDRTLANDVVLSGDLTVSGSNSVTFNGYTTLSGTSAGVNNSTSVTFGGAIGDGGAGLSFAKSGTGTTTFSGSSANTFTGVLAVNQGTLILDKSPNVQALGGNLTIGTGQGAPNSAIVQLDADGQLPSAGSVTINIDGQLNLQGNSATTTNLVMTGGSITGGGTFTLASGAMFQFTGINASSATISSTVQISGNQDYQIASTSAATQVTISGPLVGDGTSTPISITKEGSGVLALTGANSLTGSVSITVNGGILKTTSIANASVSLNGGALGSTSSGSVVAPIQVQQLYSNNGAFVLGLGAGSTSDQIAVSGNINLDLTAGSFPTFLFEDDGFTSGSGTFTVISGGTYVSPTDLSSLQYASIDIPGLTGTFAMSGGNLVFIAEAGVTGTWSGGGGDGSWTNGANWGGTVPPSGADLTFTGTVGTSVSTVTNQTTGAITFDANAGAFTISGNTITLGGNLTNSSSNLQTIESNITLNANRTIKADTADIDISGNIALSKTGAMAGTLTFDGSQNILVSGNITDGTYGSGNIDIAGGSLIKNGTGTLTLTGSNGFSGAVTINAGTVSISQASSLGNQNGLGTNILIFNGGALALTSGMTFTQFRSIEMESTGIIDTGGNNLEVDGVISGQGGLTKDGEGTLLLSQTGTASNTYQGPTTVNGGSLAINYAGALGNTTGVTVNDGASLVISGSFTGTNALTLSGAGDGGNGALHVVTGAATATWSGSVTLGGNASIQADSTTTLDLTGAVNMGAYALTLTGSASNINLSGNLSGSGTLIKTGSSVLAISGLNTGFSGTVDVQQGVVNVGQSNSLGDGTSALVVESGAALEFSNTTDMVVSFGSITLTGTGLSTGSGPDDGTGAITTLNAAVTEITGSVTLAGNTMLGSQGGQLVMTGDINTQGNTLTLNSTSAQMVLTGNISGAGGIVTAGNSSVLLMGNNSYTGGTDIAAGTAVVVGSAQGLGSATGTTTVASGATLAFASGTSTVAGSMTVNTGTITVNSGAGVNGTGEINNIYGTNTVNAPVNMIGAVTVQATAGELILTGTVNTTNLTVQGGGTVYLAGGVTGNPTITIQSGILAAGNLPGAVVNIGTGATSGTIPVSGFSPGDLGNIANVTVQNLVPNAGAMLLMDIGPSNTSDTITTTNAPNLSGTLVFFLNNDGVGTASGSYTLVQTTSGAIVATPSTYTLTTNIAGLSGQFELENGGQDLDFVVATGTTSWTNANNSGLWGDDANWQNGYTPANGSAVTFVTGTTTSVDTQTDRTAGGIIFGTGSAGVTITNNTLNLYGQILNSSTNLQTVSSGVRLANDVTINAASGDLALTGAVNFGSYSSTPILTVTGSYNTSISGGISSDAGVSGTLVKSGTGALHLTGTNTFTGNTYITGGNLILDGTTSANNNILLLAGGTLSGTGTAAGNVLVAGTLSPGHSPGALNTGTEIWTAGGNYNWQLADATGAAGTGYDTVNITGNLDLTALTAATFAINLWTLSAVEPDTNGDAANFDGSTNYSWTLVSTTNGVEGFNSSDFTIYTDPNNGTGGFTNAFNGIFTVEVSGNNLILEYSAVPEPSTWALLAVSLVGLVFMARRERGKKGAVVQDS